MHKVGVIGSGYVGLVTAVCFAELGNKVICVDNDKEKIKKLQRGAIPFFEPGLEELVSKNRKAKSLVFSSNIKDAVTASEVIFICVGTPSNEDGSADLSAVEKVSMEIAKSMKEYKVIVEKSTVPAETGEKITRTIEMYRARKIDFDVVSNPEFLREGQAIHDTFHPDRIVVGVENPRAERIMRELYRPLKAPVIVTNINTAEIIKHASNSFLAVKISFINAIANLCDRLNANVDQVAEAMGMDSRIGRAFLNAGAGYGGSCFPKDVEAFIYLASQKGYDFELLKSVKRINEGQKTILFNKIKDALWIIKNKTIGILGLSFKPDTDDIRSSVAIEIITKLQEAGAKIKAYDPQAVAKAKEKLSGVDFCRDAYETAANSDCLVIVTEWDEFRNMDLMKIKRLLRQPVIIDGRNIFKSSKMKQLGFTYKSIGRGL